MNSKIVLFGILIVALLIVSGYYFTHGCTKEAKICPDGTAVSRVGPNCEFEECSKIENLISWSEAIIILNNGQVKEVNQFHNLNVRLILEDETTMNTIEPKLDDIINEIEKCGDTCSNIIIATE